MPAVVAQISEDLTRNPNGTAVFAHFLSPHQSHLFDDRCGIKQEVGNWSASADWAKLRDPINTHLTRRERYGGYFEQVRCVYRILGEFLDDLDRNGLMNEATIIIQGDHGSRISIVAPWKLTPELISTEDIVDQFSTLYAVKIPEIPGRYELELSASQALFSRLFLGRELSQSGPFVFLGGFNWATDEAPVSLPLPDHAIGPGQWLAAPRNLP